MLASRFGACERIESQKWLFANYWEIAGLRIRKRLYLKMKLLEIGKILYIFYDTGGVLK